MSAAPTPPLAAQYLAAALEVMPPGARELPAGSREFRRAVEAAATRLPMTLRLSRRELANAAAFLRSPAQSGGARA